MPAALHQTSKSLVQESARSGQNVESPSRPLKVGTRRRLCTAVSSRLRKKTQKGAAALTPLARLCAGFKDRPLGALRTVRELRVEHAAAFGGQVEHAQRPVHLVDADREEQQPVREEEVGRRFRYTLTLYNKQGKTTTNKSDQHQNQ